MKLFFSIMISPECNLACKHCYYSDYDNSTKLHYGTFTKMVDTVKKVSVEKGMDIEFIVRGGELSMYEENIKYYEYLLELFKDVKNINIDIRTSTNMQGKESFYKDYLKLIKKYNKNEGNDTNINMSIQYSFHLPAGLQNIANNYHKINQIFKDTSTKEYAVLAGFSKEVGTPNEMTLREMILDIDPSYKDLEIRSGTIDNVSHLYSSDPTFNTGKDNKDIYIYNLDFKGFCTNMKTSSQYNVANFKLRLN